MLSLSCWPLLAMLFWKNVCNPIQMAKLTQPPNAAPVQHCNFGTHSQLQHTLSHSYVGPHYVLHTYIQPITSYSLFLIQSATGQNNTTRIVTVNDVCTLIKTYIQTIHNINVHNQDTVHICIMLCSSKTHGSKTQSHRNKHSWICNTITDKPITTQKSLKNFIRQ